jgi:hypothetical protein
MVRKIRKGGLRRMERDWRCAIVTMVGMVKVRRLERDWGGSIVVVEYKVMMWNMRKIIQLMMKRVWRHRRVALECIVTVRNSRMTI